MEDRPKPNDPELIDNILAEVKRSGMFDQFRKDCISDVDTKPAYQNLQFKVENTVSSFLSNQKWSPDMNRNQLREKLRKNILDTSYLDTGIERIVDQVLHPKMASFQSQIEELVYSYLKIDRPKRKIFKIEHVKEEYNASLLPNDLEAVSSPESDKNNKHLSGSLEELDKDDDDFESPAFEPLEGVVGVQIKKDDDSHLSGLSGLTSEGSVDHENKTERLATTTIKFESLEADKQDEDSQLSEVSSGSRLSIIVPSEKDSESPKPEVLDITEEAQMPKFNENSNSIDTKEKPTIGEQRSIFDFKKEEIEFKGPGRKSLTLDEKLKEEIYESENKHSSTFKMEEIESNSQSSEIKLEIVEHSQQYTGSESVARMETDSIKYEEDIKQEPTIEQQRTSGKADSPSSRSKHYTSSEKRDRGISSSSHHKSSRSKHSSRDKEDEKYDRKRHGSEYDRRSSSSKHSSNYHSKSRHNDKEKGYSSTSKHKSSHYSSSKDRDRHSKDQKTVSKDKHHRDKDRSRERGKDEKRQSDEYQQDIDKEDAYPVQNVSENSHLKQPENMCTDELPESVTKIEPALESPKPQTPEPRMNVSDNDLEQHDVVEDISTIENLTQSHSFREEDEQETFENAAISDYQEEYHVNEAPVQACAETDQIEEDASIISGKNEQTIESPRTKQQCASDTPPKLDFISDEDDFFGFPETDSANASSSNMNFITPTKVSKRGSATPKQQSLKKMLTNRSILDEDSFYGFDDMSPMKSTDQAKESSHGKSSISEDILRLPVKDVERPPTPDIHMEDCVEQYEINPIDKSPDTNRLNVIDCEPGPENSKKPTQSAKKRKKESTDDSRIKTRKINTGGKGFQPLELPSKSNEEQNPDSESPKLEPETTVGQTDTSSIETSNRRNIKRSSRKETKSRRR